MIWRCSFADGVFAVILLSLVLVGMYRFGLALTLRSLRKNRDSDNPFLRATAVKRAAVAQTQNTLDVRLGAVTVGIYLLIPLHGWENVIPAIASLAIFWVFFRMEVRRLREIEAGR
jgi:hypothetical protein